MSSEACEHCGQPLGAPHALLPTDCILGHPDHAERFAGYACKRHYHWIDRTLQQIEELFALTDDVLVKVSSAMSGDGRGGTQTGSPAPGRLDVIAFTDPRLVPRAEHLNWYENSDGRGGLESNGGQVRDLPGSLAQWARMVVEERDATDELSGCVTESVRVLRRERHWIARQAWLDDYVAELAELHRDVARAVGDTMWPQPIGKCPNDQAPLYNTIGVDSVTCRRCKATWSGVHLARLRLIHEQDKARKPEAS